jgi:hypothetical protein
MASQQEQLPHKRHMCFIFTDTAAVITS